MVFMHMLTLVSQVAFSIQGLENFSTPTPLAFPPKKQTLAATFPDPCSRQNSSLPNRPYHPLPPDGT